MTQVATYDMALVSTSEHAQSGVAANFKALAAGSLAFLIGHTWADKADRKAADAIKSDVQIAFADTVGKKSKAYEFSALALTIARHLSKGNLTADNAWQVEAKALLHSEGLEPAVTFLANRFHSVAHTVAALAAHFAGEKKEKAAKAIDFAKALDDLIEKTLEAGQEVPVSAAVNALLVCGEVSPMDTSGIISRLVKAFDAHALAHLIDHLNDTLGQRLDVERKASEQEEQRKAA